MAAQGFYAQRPPAPSSYRRIRGIAARQRIRRGDGREPLGASGREAPAGHSYLHSQGQDAALRPGDCRYRRKAHCGQAEGIERNRDASADLPPAARCTGDRARAPSYCSTGFAASGLGLNRPLVCEVVVGLVVDPLARYGTPGTPELTDALEPLIPHHDAILMAQSRKRKRSVRPSKAPTRQDGRRSSTSRRSPW